MESRIFFWVMDGFLSAMPCIFLYTTSHLSSSFSPRIPPRYLSLSPLGPSPISILRTAERVTVEAQHQISQLRSPSTPMHKSCPNQRTDEWYRRTNAPLLRHLSFAAQFDYFTRNALFIIPNFVPRIVFPPLWSEAPWAFIFLSLGRANEIYFQNSFPNPKVWIYCLSTFKCNLLLNISY